MRGLVFAIAWLAGCGRLGFDASEVTDDASKSPQTIGEGAPRLVVGDDHACVRDPDGVRCWGQNDHGQVAPVIGASVLVPTRVAPDATWVDFGLGQNHTCALDDAGHVWCWGEDDFGQLGLAPPGCGNDQQDASEMCDDGNTFNGDSCNATCSGALPVDQPRPTRVPDERIYRRVFGADFQTCALAIDDSLWCWGKNALFALGIGDADDRAQPTQITIPGEPDRDRRWRTLAMANYSACGLQTDQTIWCWGHSADGALGVGAVPDQPRPVQVAWPRPFRAIAAGAIAVCAIDDASALVCWGSNGEGQLGLPGQLMHDTPTMIDPGPWSAIAGGSYHACAIAPDGTARCWGDNDLGQVGNGTMSPTQPTPTAITNAWRELAAGDGFTCGIQLDDTGWCWGQAASGRLGNDSETAGSAVPIQTF